MGGKMKKIIILATFLFSANIYASIDYKLDRGIYNVECKSKYDLGNSAYSIQIEEVFLDNGALRISANFFNMTCKKLIEDKVMFMRELIPSDWSIVALNWHKGWFDLPTFIGVNNHKLNAKKGGSNITIPLDGDVLKRSQLKKMKNGKPFILKLTLHLGKETDYNNETFVRSQGYWDLKLQFKTNKSGELQVHRIN
jgi:hypothetical protein